MMTQILLLHLHPPSRRGVVTALEMVARGGGGVSRFRRSSSDSLRSLHLVAHWKSTTTASRIPRTLQHGTTVSTNSAAPPVRRPLSSLAVASSTIHPDDTLDGESVLVDVITAVDYEYMTEAIQCATRGWGHTFPNPAVGCVVVRTTTTTDTTTGNKIATNSNHVILGRGFHPRAGFPHAEVFALLEAAGHVDSGLDAAQAIVNAYNNNNKNSQPKNDDDDNDVQQQQQQLLVTKVQQLSDQYSSPGGPEALLADCLRWHPTPTTSSANAADSNTTTKTTAYVTLEPCCHYGRTPPCAVALQLAKVDRVVVGFRDPNPRVDGGGVQLLQTAGISVQMLRSGGMEKDSNNNNNNAAAVVVAQRCAGLVTNFVKRITPRTTSSDTGVVEHWQDALIGKHRMALRAHANRLQSRGQLEIRSWNGHQGSSVAVDETMAETIAALPLPAEWMEQVDDALWKSELVLLRLSKAVAKRKGVKLLGTRIAEQLQAHVAQSKVGTARRRTDFLTGWYCITYGILRMEC